MKKLVIVSMVATMMSVCGNGVSHGTTINIVSILNETNEEIAMYVYDRSQPLGMKLKQAALFISPQPGKTRAKKIKEPIVTLGSSKIVDPATNNAQLWFDVIGLSQVTKQYNYNEDMKKPELFLSFKTAPFSSDSPTIDIDASTLTRRSNKPVVSTVKIDKRDVIIGKLVVRKTGDSIVCTIQLTTDYKKFYQGEF